MASTDRHSVHAILKRARKTVGRAGYAAAMSDQPDLADELYLVSVELDRLIASTVPAGPPLPATPRDCA